MRPFAAHSALNTSFCISLTLGSILASSPANASVSIAITRQDTGNIFGSLPAYQYDSAGNLLGPIGPQGNSSFIQDIAYDSATGDLWALITNPNDASAATIANLTQNTSFAAGVDVFANKGGNIAVFSPGVVIPEPTSVIVWSMLAVFAGIVASYRRKGRCGSLSTV